MVLLVYAYAIFECLSVKVGWFVCWVALVAILVCCDFGLRCWFHFSCSVFRVLQLLFVVVTVALWFGCC